MKRISLIVIIASIVFTFSATIAYAGYCTPYSRDWFYPRDDIQNPPFADSNMFNVHIADFRGTSCGMWVVYRGNSVIYVDAEVKEDGKWVKQKILLTKEIGSIYTKYVELVYKINFKDIKRLEKSKYASFRKIDERTWQFIESKPAVMFAMENENCEVRDLESGKILRTQSDGFFISNRFVVVELTK